MGSPYAIVSISLLSGPYMGPLWVCSYDLVRMEPIGVLYELGFWAPYGSFVDVPIWACLFGTDMGFYGLTHMDKPVYIPHCPLWGAHMGLSVCDPYVSYKGVPIKPSPYTSHTGPNWACFSALWECTYGFDPMGPIWVLYGRDHMGNSHTSLTWSIWKCYLGTHGSIIGLSICACPHWTHIGCTL